MIVRYDSRFFYFERVPRWFPFFKKVITADAEPIIEQSDQRDSRCVNALTQRRRVVLLSGLI